MALISILSRLVAGAQHNVDLSANTLVVGALNTGTNTLTDAILGRLLNTQDGSDLGTGFHTHNTQYYTKAQLNAHPGGGASGADLIGDGNTYTHITPSTTTVEAALAALDAAVGSSTTATDSVFRIVNTSDPTKKIAFSAGTIATGTVRTITMPDADVNLADVNNAILKDGSRAFTQNQPMGAHKLTGLSAGTGAGDSVRYEQAILTSGANAFGANQSLGSFNLTNVADPASPQDAATKAYVDSLLDGRDWKQHAIVATTANITLSGEQTIDGILTSGSRVLVKNQTAPEENGIYVSAAGAWARSSDANTSLELTGAAIFVSQGTVGHDLQFAQTADSPVVGTDPIVWVVTSANSFSGHDMIILAGGQISVDLATASGLESTNPGNAAGQLRIKLEASNPSLKFSGSNELGIKFDAAGALLSGASGVAVQVDNSSIEISSNALRVKAGGITLAMHAANSVDENKIVSTSFSASGAITGGSGTKIAAQVDGSTLEISSNAIRQKDAGTTAAKLNTNAFDQVTITGGAGSAAAVQSAPLAKRTLVAGEAMAANTSFAVRWALTGETAGRVYKADKDASSTNKYCAIGIALSAAGVTAGQNIDVVMLGEFTLGSSDTPFAGGDVGKELYVGSSGAYILGAALAGTANEAAFCLGVVQTTTKVWVDQKTLRGIS